MTELTALASHYGLTGLLIAAAVYVVLKNDIHCRISAEVKNCAREKR